MPKGSNSTEHKLSEVNFRIEIRFVIIYGEIRTLLREKEFGLEEKDREPEWVTGRVEPLPKVMLEELEEMEEEERIPGSNAM